MQLWEVEYLAGFKWMSNASGKTDMWITVCECQAQWTSFCWAVIMFHGNAEWIVYEFHSHADSCESWINAYKDINITAEGSITI